MVHSVESGRWSQNTQCLISGIFGREVDSDKELENGECIINRRYKTHFGGGGGVVDYLK